MPKLSEWGIVHNILILLLLLAGISAGLFLVKNPKIFKSGAAIPPIIFKSADRQPLPVINGVAQTTSPKVIVELTSTLGSPVSADVSVASGSAANRQGTVSYKAALTPPELGTLEFQPYTKEPAIYQLELADTQEIQFFWAEFKDAKGVTDRKVAQIQLVSAAPTKTPPAAFPDTVTSPTPAPVVTTLGKPKISVDVPCITSGYTQPAVTISWINPTGKPTRWIDISDNRFFNSYYHKQVLTTATSTIAPDGFKALNNKDLLSLNPNTTYYVRLYNYGHSQAESFSVGSCSGGSPTPSPTVTPTPTPTPTPTAACSLTSASWNLTTVNRSSQVYLNAQASGSCAGRQVTFEVHRSGANDTLSAITTQPQAAFVNGSLATTGWIAERNPFIPLTDPQYYFRATVVGGNTVTSSNLRVTDHSVISTGTTITINPTMGLHPSSSLVLGANRNHVNTNFDFANGAAKLAKMKELQPNWGGGKYLYRNGHGITDGARGYTGYHFEQVWDRNGPYPYDDLRNYLREANTMGAAQIHVVNFGSSNPQEAARYVSFLNNNNDTNRAGHPYNQQNVQLFEIGNEISWSGEVGHYAHADTEVQYATRAKQFAQAMRAKSDVPIQIGAVVTDSSNWLGHTWSGEGRSVENILRIMGSDVDFLIFHGYPSWPMGDGNNPLSVMAQNTWNRNKIETRIKPAIQRAATGRDIWIANTEFSARTGSTPFATGIFGALYSADSIITAMVEDIRVAVEFSLSHRDNIDSSFFINDNPNQPTAIFKWHKMLSKHWGDYIVQVTGQQIPSVSVRGLVETVNMPKLGFTAAIKGDKVYVLVVNRVNDTDVVSNINPGFMPTNIVAYELAGANGWESHNNVDVVTITNPSLTNYRFKKASITIFEISGFNGN